MQFIEITNLKKYFIKDNSKRLILDIPTFSVEKGEQIVITGKSGLGKTTLLHLLAGLEVATEGELIVNDHKLNELNEKKRDSFRGHHVGMIFQKFHLFEGLTAYENTIAGMILLGETKKDKALKLLDRLQLSSRLNDNPKSLSSGQQQRVAIARSLVMEPTLILADEPTAGSDPENAKNVINLLKEESEKLNATLIIVTHDQNIKNMFDKHYDLMDISNSNHLEIK
ncbi:MAG: hypothetical protein COA79_11640 [Planctomycetota bacterium]|nr:MAG: hypothetical protein COA79_11640 [Planctomycetota bacterium]